MPVAMSSLGAAAVTAIYLIYGAYRDHVQSRLRRDDLLRARVAFLLWNLAGTDAGGLDFRSPCYPGGHLGNHRFLLL
jgi:hypothetical protein